MIRIALSAVFLFTASTATWAYCSEPSASLSVPDAPGSYSKPSVPYCLQEFRYSGKHTCDDWEITSYQRDVEEYVDKLQEYLNEAVEIANEATRYAEEANEYARCEAEDVSTQHK